MTERLRASSVGYNSPKMESDLSPRKTMLVLVIVVGCFAVLWPKVFYPMLVGSASQHIKPSPIDKATDIRQERPHHLRSELIHPAFRERGRAIPQPQTAPPTRPPPRVVEGRPGPIPGMRPTIGGAGHVVPPSKQGTSSMSVIMPIYTIGIVIFFTYTLMKIIFKKQPQGIGGTLYPPVDPDPHFRKEVFESEASRLGPRLTRENISSKLGWIERDARDAELDQLRQRLRETELAMERIVEQMSKVPLKAQDLVNGNLSNGDAVKPHDDEQPTVKVLGMEMTASCEGGKKWSRPGSPVLPTPSPTPSEPAPPPQEIYLEGALPAQSQLLVADSAIEPEPVSGEDPAVVLSGKMTLSVISPDSENGVEEMENDASLQKSEQAVKKENDEIVEQTKFSPERHAEETENDTSDVQKGQEIENNVSIQRIEEIVEKTPEEDERPKLGLEKDVEDFLKKLQEQNEIPTPSITFDSDDLKETIEVEELEKEVAGLIQEAIENIQQRVEPNEINENSEPNNLDLIDEKSNNIESFINHEEKQNLEDISKPIHNDVSLEAASEECQIQNKPIEEIKHNEEIENDSKLEEPLADEELGSDEEVEEIEEIVYEEETEDEEEEIEIEVEESDEEIANDVNLNRTESSSVQRVNGERSEDFVEESKYTTVSGATAAENDISDEELTDEEVEEEEEEEEIVEVEDEENENDLNHVSGDSGPEL
nr:PREDICTED: patellin-5 isoform X5 [Tribolium castaneum]|eukprot:XP_008195614.1 PREDICTED: patellin-5 isoform X5 [Tribolium castaneum]